MVRIFVATVLVVLFACGSADARGRAGRHHHRDYHRGHLPRTAPAVRVIGGCMDSFAECAGRGQEAAADPVRVAGLSPVIGRFHEALGPRPRAWCGWWLRGQVAGDPGPQGNLARWWTHYGPHIAGPQPGAIAVWPHHVGIVTAVLGDGQIMLKSGNDGHAVRERARSTRGVIAWVMPSYRLASR